MHGLSSNRTMGSGTMKDLVSEGYVVFCMDHHDGTSSYYVEPETGKGRYYDLQKIADMELRKRQLDIRVRESKCLIDEICSGRLLERIEGPIGLQNGQSLEASELIMSGHSMGGITAILVCSQDHRPKACLTLDPWLYAYHKEIAAGEIKVKCPVSFIHSEMFHPSLKEFDSWAAVQKLF